MADRLHPYSMFPQNLTSNSLQQSQIPQQPPQSQQPDPQMISALSNPEHSRMWQQMNEPPGKYLPARSPPPRLSLVWENSLPHVNEMCMSYPYVMMIYGQSPLSPNYSVYNILSLGSALDTIFAPAQVYMQDFARGQALSHGQPIVRQIQQSFGLNAQRMNPGPVFHDPQANQPQSLIPPNFPNVPMNTQQMKAAFNMNPMMHTAMSNPGVSRQLKMLNQQEIARLQQSGLGVQHPPNQPTAVDMFASTSMQASQDQMHGSPHPAAQPVGPPGTNQGMVPGNQQPGIQKRMMTMTQAEFQERRNYLLTLISQSENNMASLLQTAHNTTSIDPHMQQKLSQLRTELTSRKEMYTKFVATFGAMVTQQLANGMPPSNMPHINPIAHPTPQQPQQAAVSNAQVQPSFVTQASQPVTAQYNIPVGNGPSPMPTQSQSALNQQIPIPPTPIVRPNTIPPRTGSTPHQTSGGQLPSTISPNLGNFATQGGQKVPNQTRQPLVMPLDKQRFDSTYSQFCRSQNINPGLRVTIGENRMVDLHQLHVYVMHEGGAQSVTQRDMWAVIGGRLGIIQFPGTDSEPARCGPGIAQQLQHTYEQCLQHFEHAYILTVKNRPTTGSPQQPMQQINQNPLAIGNNGTPGMSGNPPEMPPNPPRPLINQQLIAAAARYAHMSAQDMRAQRVHDQMIVFVERHRTELRKVYQQQVQLFAKRNAEQEQQNIANTQGPNMHEQTSINLQPGAQRPPQGIGANTMVSVPSADTKMVNGSFVPENVAAALHKQPPTQDQIQHAVAMIDQLKHVFQQRRLHGMATQPMPDEQRPDYNQLLEQVYKMTSELDARLHMYFVVFKNEELLRKYVAIVMTVARQRQLVSTPSPQYIINLLTLRNMQMQIHKLNEEFENRWRAMRASAVAAANANPPQHASLISTPARSNPAYLSVPPMQNTSHMTPAPQGTGRPGTINSSPPHQSSLQLPPPPRSHSQPNQSHPHSQQQSVSQSIKKAFRPSIPPSPSALPAPATLASPTPPPAVALSSTPATSVPTPQTTVGSPQTPKSPPSKVAAKTKSTTRAARKLSTAGKGPATPETAPSVAGVKRPPEEDVAALTSVALSEAEASHAPSPKKAKTEWEGETSEALLKKQQELENIKTDDDAAAFFDRMKELFAMSASTDNEIHHDIASTLDQILAGVAQEPADAALSVRAGDAGPPPTALSPHTGPANDAFLEYIDFSSFTTLEDEDSDSKAPTPDLVSSSETNPSPESGSEGDLLGSTGSPDKTKIEEPGDRSDPLRLGSLREIDGGESAYYQADNWKWEGTMHTLEQPWAIFTS
ncbi:hypothetical protein J3R82DRAFT_11673 [Butyriboletus roseoflavus]|nr:hypothetical protein J3R82DRAFT_11673 [Butyriboletus roseoflavus]